MTTAIITGCSRGIGFEFARQYAGDGWEVIATCRQPGNAAALQAVADASGGRMTVRQLDVTDPQSRATLGRDLQGQPIDLLINNAGVYGPGGQAFGKQTDERAWMDVLRVNGIAPLKVTEMLIDNVAASELRIVAMMSSGMGSISSNTYGGAYLYRSSKAALNSVTKSLAIDLAERGINVVALCPGWVRTDMGGPEAPLDVEVSVRGLREVLANLTPARTGSFIRHDGELVPW